jgi:serine/threonine-protein kinase HipA
MAVTREALRIDRKAMLGLAGEAEVPAGHAAGVIDRLCDVVGQIAANAENQFPRAIAGDALRTIQTRIDENIDLLR